MKTTMKTKEKERVDAVEEDVAINKSLVFKTKMMKKHTILLAVLILAGFIGLNACSNNNDDELEASIARLSDEPIEAPGPVVHQAGQARYEDYTPERLEELKGGQKFGLFFHADWCPTCRRLEEKLLKDLESMGPMIILKADYDTELDLKIEHEVGVQTTVVFFDETGEVAQKKLNPSLSQIREFFAN